MAQIIQLSLNLPSATRGEDFDVTDTGAIPQFVPGPIGVQHVEPDMAAANAGLRDGDALLSVDGHQFHSVQALLAYLHSGKGKPVSLVAVRNGVTLAPMIAHPTIFESDWKLGFTPVPIPFKRDPLSLGQAAVKSEQFCADNSSLIVEVIGRIFTRKVAVSQLSGPVGIARMAGMAAEMKEWQPKFALASAISFNLGILNLMPFPILDGGMILLLLIESVLRRDISINVKERIYQAAFVMIVAFFAFIIFNDVTKLPIFTHLKP